MIEIRHFTSRPTLEDIRSSHLIKYLQLIHRIYSLVLLKYGEQFACDFATVATIPRKIIACVV